MPEIIVELVTRDAVKRVAVTLKMSQTMTPLEYDEVANIPPHESYKRAIQLVHTMYRMIERKPENYYGIKSVLRSVAKMHELVKRWDDTGKHLNFLAEPLFISCALFVNLVIEYNMVKGFHYPVRFSPRAPASGVVGRRMFANVSQNSSNRGFLQSRHLGDLASIT